MRMDSDGVHFRLLCCELVPALPLGRESWAFDERVLGSSEFVAALQAHDLEQRGSHVPPPSETTLPALLQEVADRWRFAVAVDMALTAASHAHLESFAPSRSRIVRIVSTSSNPLLAFETALRASSGRTENRAIPFALRSPGGASRSARQFFNRLLRDRVGR